MDTLLLFLVVALAINVAMFIPAFLFKTDKLTDISYSLSFIALGVFAYLESTRNSAHMILLGMVCLWAVRLGGFLLIRIWKMKRDKRFDGMRESLVRFLGFWLLQGVSVFVVLLSSLVFWQEQNVELDIISLGGVYVFVIGLLIEATADLQKYRFNKLAKNKGKWISSGLWGMSRHPNYFGEILVWLGVWLYVLPYVEGLNLVWVLVSPVYITVLLLFVSGVPLLEKASDKKWGKDKDYQKYKKKTPVLVPFLK